jgi:hypothetical protein
MPGDERFKQQMTRGSFPGSFVAPVQTGAI